MANEEFLLSLYFSYGQFMVFDRAVRLPGCDWTDLHFAQGFARRSSTLNVRTLSEFGHADVRVIYSPYVSRDEYLRVIAVPFLVESGEVVVEGPEEIDTGRIVRIPPGNYRLVVAQALATEEDEVIDLFFERVTKLGQKSEVLLHDEALNPPLPLLETAEVAGK